MFQSHDHHIKDDVCLTRPPYRNGKKLRAVKVYTIGQESKYLLIQNIPSISGSIEQLLPYFNQYGHMEQYWKLDEYKRKDLKEGDEFFYTILIKFLYIQKARIAKSRLDDINFMGSNLHICYAPEYENLNDLREKFHERKTIVQYKNRINNLNKEKKFIKKQSNNTKKINVISSTIKSTSLQSYEQTTNDIRNKMREIVQKSNLIPIVLKQDIKKKKRLQI